ncbi:MAG: MFS transporter [Deltaproteobacteria bacterium]|nr:MFS transporter [Deltaproteobacteria bacterium]MBW2121867.1 MFS transporter [Deltaproteobacteria bacterium]
MPRERETQRSTPLYGWYVLASSFVILFFNSGARYSFGVTFKPMITEFGWDRGSISLVFFLNMTLYALSLTLVGKAYDRYGPKWVILVSTVFVSSGYGLISRIGTIWQFCISYGVIAAIGLGGPSVTLMAAITSKWFEKWRGAAISLALSGNSIGQFVLVPIITLVVSRYGWRTSYLLISLIMFGVNTVLAFSVIRGDPEDLGYRPFGSQHMGEVANPEEGPPSNGPPHDMSLREAMGTPSFWFFLVVMFICGSGDFLVTTHLIPWVTDYGISPFTAGHMLAWLGLMSLAGMLVAGPVSDLFGNKIPIALTFLLRSFLFLLILKYQNLFSFYVFALAFGFTLLITAPLNATLMGKLYGFSHVGLITGFITTIHHLGGGFWAYMGGRIFDRTGGYGLAFFLSAVMALVAMLAALLITEKRHRPLR